MSVDLRGVLVKRLLAILLILSFFLAMPIAQEKGADGEVPFYVAWVWHFHQPIYHPYYDCYETMSLPEYSDWLPSVFEERVGVYKEHPPSTVLSDRVQSDPTAAFQVSFTGTLIEDLNSLEENNWKDGVYSGWKNLWRQAAQTTTSRGYRRLNFLGTLYFHGIGPLLNSTDVKEQLLMHQQAIADTFNVGVDAGVYLPEVAFSEELVPVLADLGFEYVVVDDLHIFRATSGFENTGTFQPDPDASDVVNPDPGDWMWVNDIWCGCKVSPTLTLRPHVVSYGGREIVVFPRFRFGSGAEMNGVWNIFSVISQLQQYNTDPERPFIMVIVHDGDNGWFLQDGNYWNDFLLETFFRTIQEDPQYSYVKCIGLTEYLREVYDPREDSGYPWKYVHVESGSWETAGTWGEPWFPQWNYLDQDSLANTLEAVDQLRWQSITAAHNKYYTALQKALDSGQVAEYQSELDQAKRYLLMSETSCYFYWDGDQLWDEKTFLCTNKVDELVSGILSDLQGVPDRTPPSAWIVNRLPYTGSSTYTIFAYAYDCSGITSARLYYRPEGGAWSSVDMSYDSSHNCYYAQVSLSEPVVYEYYVRVVDGAGNTIQTPVRRVSSSAQMTNANDFSDAELVCSEDLASNGPDPRASLSRLYFRYNYYELVVGVDWVPQDWVLSLGIAIDVDHDPSSGYSNDTGGDAWNRKVSFQPPYLPDYIVYFYYDGSQITSAEICTWTAPQGTTEGRYWEYTDLSESYYSSVATDRYSTIFKVRIPWSWIGAPRNDTLVLCVWIAGMDAGSSAVSSLPYNPSLHDKPYEGENNEWVDFDVIEVQLSLAIEEPVVPEGISFVVIPAAACAATLVLRKSRRNTHRKLPL